MSKNKYTIALYEARANVCAEQARKHYNEPERYYAWLDAGRAYYAAAVCAKLADGVPAVAATARRHELKHAERARSCEAEALAWEDVIE